MRLAASHQIVILSSRNPGRDARHHHAGSAGDAPVSDCTGGSTRRARQSGEGRHSQARGIRRRPLSSDSISEPSWAMRLRDRVPRAQHGTSKTGDHRPRGGILCVLKTGWWWAIQFKGCQRTRWTSADDAVMAAVRHSGLADWDRTRLSVSDDLLRCRPIGENL